MTLGRGEISASALDSSKAAQCPPRSRALDENGFKMFFRGIHGSSVKRHFRQCQVRPHVVRRLFKQFPENFLGVVDIACL